MNFPHRINWHDDSEQGLAERQNHKLYNSNNVIDKSIPAANKYRQWRLYTL